MTETTTTDRRAACNSGFAKKRVQWLIEHSTSYQHLWFIDSLVLRNPLLRKPANRYVSPYSASYTYLNIQDFAMLPHAIFSTWQGAQNPDTKPTLPRAKNANAQPAHPG